MNGRHSRILLVCLAGMGAFFAPARCSAQYTISTVAGGVSAFFFAGTGDGGPATSAGLANPVFDVAVDNSGNLYIAAGTLVRKVTSTGAISTFAGGGAALGESVSATQAALMPIALALDAAGNLYIADTAFGISRIRKVNNAGIITTVAGGAQCCALGDGGPARSAYLGTPYGIAVDTAGNLYIAQADGQNNVIRKVSAASGSITTIAGGGPCCAAGDGGPATGVGLSRPTGVAVDLAGNVYIAESTGNRIRKVSPGGIISTVAGSGAAANSGDGGPAVQAGINAPWHVAVDPGNTLYVTQTGDGQIRMVTSADGTISTIAGGGAQAASNYSGPALSAVLDRPAGITYGGQGVYFAQESLSIATVRLLTPPRPPPVILSGGVVPVFSSSTTIQPGSWVSIYGNNLATGTAIWNADFPVSLGGTSVIINSKPAYLWFVSPGQINLQAPDDTATGSVSVVVTTNAGSGSSTATLGKYGPAFNLFNSRYPAAIVPTAGPGNSGAGYDYIGPAGALPFPTRPVKAGETLLLFGVGFGSTNPPVAAGKIFSGAAPSVVLPQVTIGGVQARVDFAGLIEAGLFQFNVVVPAAGTGDRLLKATIDGVATPDNVFITLQ